MKLMKIIKILDEDTVIETDVLYCNKYKFGDQIPKGFPVKITLNQEGELEVSADWPEAFNPEYLKEKALRYVIEMIELGETFSTMPDSEEEDGYIILNEVGD